MTDNTTIAALLPCPFCGCKTFDTCAASGVYFDRNGAAVARCGRPECGAEIIGDTVQSVTDAWNRRFDGQKESGQPVCALDIFAVDRICGELSDIFIYTGGAIGKTCDEARDMIRDLYEAAMRVGLEPCEKRADAVAKR